MPDIAGAGIVSVSITILTRVCCADACASVKRVTSPIAKMKMMTGRIERIFVMYRAPTSETPAQERRAVMWRR